MLQKTNQFNLTTRRHSLSQLGAWLETRGRWAGWTLRTRDRFADQGVVGCLLARAVEEGAWEIDSFLLSCRALGRGFETALLSHGLRRLRALGAASVVAHYIPTDRNGQVRTFYPQHGADLVSTAGKGPDGSGTTSYRFDLTQESRMVEVPAWIRLEEETRG
jgi:FkbH-like protein